MHLPLLTERLVSMPTIKISRTEILQRCLDVLHHEGYNGASISMLAAATGLGKAGLLHHFGSKEGLMQSVLTYAFAQFEGYVLSVAYEPIPPEQRLEKLLRRQNRIAKRERNGCFFANLGLEVGRQTQFSVYLKHFFEQWQLAVAHIFSDFLPLAEAQQQAYQLLLEHEGAIIMYKITGDEHHLEQLVRRAIDRFAGTAASGKIKIEVSV